MPFAAHVQSWLAELTSPANRQDLLARERARGPAESPAPAGKGTGPQKGFCRCYPQRECSRPPIQRSPALNIHDAMRRGMDAQGLEWLIAGRAKPMQKVRGQDQRHAWLQLHELIVTLQPSLALARQYRDRLEIGMRVGGGFVTGRRILNTDADGRRAVCVADKRQIGRSAFERFRYDVAVAHNWHCPFSHYRGRHVQGGSEGRFVSDPSPTIARSRTTSQRKSGTRPWPMAQGKLAQRASASLVSYHIPVCNLPSSCEIEDAEADKGLLRLSSR